MSIDRRAIAAAIVLACAVPAQEAIPSSTAVEPAAAAAAAPAKAAPEGMVLVPGGRFVMGSQNDDLDAPRHEVEVGPFWLDATEVTNAQFAAFVAATHYQTDAERTPTAEELPGVPEADRVPGALVFTRPAGEVDLREFWRWWTFVPGASWRHPQGPGSSIEGRDRHPVVQVSWHDATAYAKWAGKRLPTEAEWEFAARGGRDQQRYVWGDEQCPGGEWQANIWQGTFPLQNELRDGYAATAPVRSFAANRFGLYDMSGNVWEWVQDLYRPDGYGDGRTLQRDPKGPKDSFDPAEPGVSKRVMRGGSFLCSDEYCRGYEPGTRMKSTPDTGLCHTGFRCARDRAP